MVNLGQIQNEMNKKSRSCTFTFSQLCIFLLGSTHNINLYPSHLVQLADEKHSLLISVHLVEGLQHPGVGCCNSAGKSEQKLVSRSLSKHRFALHGHLAKCPSFSLCRVCSLHICLHSSTAPFRNIFTELETPTGALIQCNSEKKKRISTSREDEQADRQ